MPQSPRVPLPALLGPASPWDWRGCLYHRELGGGLFDLSPGGAHRTCPRTKLQGWGDAWTAEQWHKLDRCQVQEPLRFPRSDDVKDG